ncbi:hypothetical protein ACLOJK_017445 [Asimina triloba]
MAAEPITRRTTAVEPAPSSPTTIGAVVQATARPPHPPPATHDPAAFIARRQPDTTSSRPPATIQISTMAAPPCSMRPMHHAHEPSDTNPSSPIQRRPMASLAHQSSSDAPALIPHRPSARPAAPPESAVRQPTIITWASRPSDTMPHPSQIQAARQPFQLKNSHGQTFDQKVQNPIEKENEEGAYPPPGVRNLEAVLVMEASEQQVMSGWLSSCLKERNDEVETSVADYGSSEDYSPPNQASWIVYLRPYQLTGHDVKLSTPPLLVLLPVLLGCGSAADLNRAKRRGAQ